MLVKKTDQVRALVAQRDYAGALRIASKFRMLAADDKKALVMAHECRHSPDFYRQLGLDTDALQQKGITVLQRLYG
ncbi:hypothetical protein [Neisseria shayeganii]|uniref:Uncharacterized protein n=1 Tax=Neisseria shayeganii TaxID=607712 RepID=A0A7D7ND33_9NEIS|nr:hypothetical protein [Neisseria shayeganii]QMT41258.1 hypothetical protein H3L94_04310 [Neisseria shayeganii]